MSIKRRDFLKQSALILGAASNAGWIVKAVSADEKQILESYTGLGIETWKNSVCRLCPGGCGIRIRLVDNHPVKIEGNPLSPINRGGLCPMGHSGLQVLYNPDRLKAPLKRTGERGANQWEPVSWKEAILLIKQKLEALRQRNKPHHFVFLDGDSRGLMKRLINQFMNAYGSPNFISLSSQANKNIPLFLMQGSPRPMAYDFSKTHFILSFGNDMLDTEGPPVWMAKMFGQMRQNRYGPRVKIVQVDSRFSMTAAKADKWIPVKPGTSGLLALGIAYILIVESLYDQEYINRYTFGFEDWTDEKKIRHTGFKNFVLRNYYPEKVSQLTGVPINDIIRTARSFAENHPAVAIYGKDVIEHSNNLYSQMAIHALNALVGSLGKSGGIVKPPLPLPTAFPRVVQDNIARWGTSRIRVDQNPAFSTELPINNFAQFVHNLPSRKPYPVEILFIHHANPVFKSPDGQRIKEAFLNISLIVSFSSFMDESSEIADIILPDHTYLEKWDLDFELPNIPFAYAGINQPIVEPRLNTRHTGDIIIELARGLSDPIKKSIPFKDYFTLVQSEAEAIFNSGRGFIPANEFDEFMYGYLSQRGFKFQKYTAFQDFWADLVDKGGWIENPPPLRKFLPKFKTPTHKFEFYSLILKHQLEKTIQRQTHSGKSDEQNLLETLHIQARGEEIFLPHFEAPQFIGEESRYPYHLRPFSILTLFDGDGANRPMLMEMVGFRHYIRWNSWAEINPETAQQHGIRDGDWIWIETEKDRIKLRAKLFRGAMPGVIYVPLGLGHTTYGKYAKGHGVNPNKIITLKADPLSGNITRNAMRVRIYKA